MNLKIYVKLKGSKFNDFFDKNNSLVDSNNVYYNRTVFNWGSLWRVPDEEDNLNGNMYDKLKLINQIYFRTIFFKM